MIAKTTTRDVPNRRYKQTTFFFSLESPICCVCGEKIGNDQYFWVCSDMKLNKIWCEKHYTDDHVKTNWTMKDKLNHHYEYLFVLKICSEETYKGLETESQITID